MTATSYCRLVFLILAILAGGGISTGQAGVISFEQLRWEFLTYQNQYRAQHAAAPYLIWSTQLATDAQDWANRCQIGVHSNGSNYGENLAWGYSIPKAAITAWYNERDNYERMSKNYTANYPMTVDVFNWDHRPNSPDMYGHFTQIVWQATREVGCGHAMCQSPSGQTDYWVCRYSPKGNIVPYFQENVRPASICWCKCTFLGCKNTCSGAYC